MEAVFFKVLDMSVSAVWIIIAVCVLRLLLKKAPKAITVFMWALVAVRLVCPFSFESALSLMPEAKNAAESIITLPTEYSEPSETHAAAEPATSPTASETAENDAPAYKPSARSAFRIASIVWISGSSAMLAYAAASYIRIRLRVREFVPLENGVMLCDGIAAPFILGVLRPKIYMPSHISEKDAEYVMAHECAHLKRFDHLWKPFGFLLLCVHWFNPAVWAAYILFCRDIEFACDEKVIKALGDDIKKPYSEALINCSSPRRTPTACPLAFGETGVGARIKAVLSYKKPALWVILAALAVCAVLAVCFLTNPPTNEIDVRLDAAIRENIAVENASSRPESREYAQCFDYKLLGTEKSGSEITVYMWVLYEEYSSPDKIEQGAHIPTAITLTEKDGEYFPVEYWLPRDGSHYSKDIKNKFPSRLHAKAFDKRYVSEQHENCKRQAEQYFKFVYGLENAMNNETPTASDEVRLREKYPEYFDIDTSKGLSVYVWQMAENSYNFALIADKNREYAMEDVIFAKGASAAEIRTILKSYSIPREDISYQCICNPLSSYYCETNLSCGAAIERILWE